MTVCQEFRSAKKTLYSSERSPKDLLKSRMIDESASNHGAVKTQNLDLLRAYVVERVRAIVHRMTESVCSCNQCRVFLKARAHFQSQSRGAQTGRMLGWRVRQLVRGALALYVLCEAKSKQNAPSPAVLRKPFHYRKLL